VVADGGLSLSLTARLLRSARNRPLWMLHRPGADHERVSAFSEAGADCIETPLLDSGELDMAAALRALGARGITRVLCEGGGRLAASLLRAGLVDELVWMSAGCVIGADGAAAVTRLGVEALGDAPRPELHGVETLGRDVATIWRRAPD
jgi:diaminohydroxyphosphoribosylaminopyrimidine deaminase/5-amino-6-(5-phosphoribosylamino)uracil reductase